MVPRPSAGKSSPTCSTAPRRWSRSATPSPPTTSSRPRVGPPASASKTTTASWSPKACPRAPIPSRSACTQATRARTSPTTAITWSWARSRLRASRDRRLRQQHEEGAAVARLALDPDAPAVAADDLFADVQPQTHAAGAPRNGVFGLKKKPKDRVELMFGNTHARIVHAELDPVRSLDHAHVDRATMRRELDRVADQVVQHLFKVVAVRTQRRLAGVDPNLVRARRHLQARTDLVDQLRGGNLFQVQVELARLDARDVEELIH